MTPIYSKVDDDGDLDDARNCKFLMGRLCRKSHALRGHGLPRQWFDLLIPTRLRIHLRNSHTFHAEEGKRIQVALSGTRRNTTDLKDRPDIRFENKLTSGTGRGTGKINSCETARMRVTCAAHLLYVTFAGLSAVQSESMADVVGDFSAVEKDVNCMRAQYVSGALLEEVSICDRLTDAQSFYLAKDYDRAAMLLLDLVDDPEQAPSRLS